MNRIALQIGSLTIYWYGIFVALGFLSAYGFMYFKARKTNFPVHKISDLCFAAMIGGVLGARIFYVIQNFDQYSGNLIEIIRVDHGGLVFFGGFFGAVLAIIWSIKRNNLYFPETADLLASGLPLGQAIGRLGCLINGCCFGTPSQIWCSVRYPPGDSVWTTQILQNLIGSDALEPLGVLPVQVFQSGTNLLIWLSLIVIGPKLKVKGQVFSLYLILYPLGRFLIEFMRGDYLNHIFGLTSAQIICLIIFPIGIVLFFAADKIFPKETNIDTPS